TLSKTVGFDSMRERILRLKSDQRELTRHLALDRFSQEYLEYFESSANSKDYLYQIQKQRALWPIRRMIEFFSDYLFRLFPCWLMSPQTVSTIFPLEKNMFDLVVFDEASQMFVENALPTIYRGNHIVVAGDGKQLRPSSGFVRRYQADDSFDYNMDLSTQAALEVESLLDLATAKFTPVHLVYHYRSMYSELIDFSNMAFYDNKLQIAPNITLSAGYKPIERIKVRGVWQSRHNHEEAVAVVKLVRNILRERKYNESIGIVTFNNEQKEYIEDMLDAEADKVAVFRKQLYLEQNRIENGENYSLFVKNLENVQGDERDIIIFSIGYAKNDYDRVVAQFGSLSTDGGENRLNVAITRAKKKIYVVTSIEPEELDNIETTKNNGPKLLKKYLLYARAVSNGNSDEVKAVLATFNAGKKAVEPIGAYEEKIKQGLESMGYTVYTNLGNTSYKLSLGVFDKTLNRFVLGIECDYRAYESSDSVLERDVYRIKFLENRGWKIVRVWSRDWWQSPKQVLQNLSSVIEEEKARLIAEREAM
ncbi:MAG: AAA domain-containing protein, partial [Christensenellales bacterium]